MRFTFKPLLKMFGLCILSGLFAFACRRENSFVPEGSASAIRFSPYGIGYYTFQGTRYLSRGVIDLCQEGPGSFILAGYRSPMESVLIRKTQHNTYQTHLNLNLIPGLQKLAEWDLPITQYQDNRRIHLIPSINGEVVYVPGSTDSIIPILRFNPDLSQKSMVLHKLFPNVKDWKNQWTQNIVACPDEKGGTYIYLNHFYVDKNDYSIQNYCFIQLNSRDSMIGFQTLSPPEISPSHLFYANQYVTFVSEFGGIWNCSADDLLQGVFNPRWQTSFYYQRPYDMISYGDSLLIITTENTTGSANNFFGAVNMRLIDLNTGKPHWEKKYLLDEPEDKFSVSATSTSSRFLVTFTANLNGRLLQLDHSGNLLGEQPIKGDQTATYINETGICGDKIWVYGLSGRGNAPQLQCFEIGVPLK